MGGEKQKNPRRTPTQTEAHPRNQELRVHIPTLHQHHQANPHNRVPQPTDPSHAQPVRRDPPDRARNERHKLVREAQRADQISHPIFDVEQVSDHEGDAGVQEDEEGDAEQTGAEQVGRGLEGRDAAREGDGAR